MVNDTISSVKQYSQAEKLFASVLDTMNVKKDPDFTLESSRAINLILLGEDERAKKIIQKISEKASTPQLREMYKGMLQTKREMLFSNFQ